MKKFFSLFILLLLSISAYGQASGPAKTIRFGASDPATCSPTGANVFFNTSSGTLKMCTATNTWSALAGGEGSGTINSGTQYQVGYYAATGNTISGSSSITTDANNNLAVSNSLSLGSTANAGQGIFLGTFFEGDQGLRLMGSGDGKAWNELGDWYSGNALYYPASGTLRDPSIYVGKSSHTYWMVHTKGNAGDVTTSFALVSSSDIQHWTLVTSVDCSEISGVNRVWAPEWFEDSDGSLHVFFAASTDGATTSSHIYEKHPTNAAMTSWSSAVQITGTGLSTTMIDPFVVKKGSTYHLFYATYPGPFEYIEYASSSSLTSGYTVTQSGNWAGWGGAEGESLVQIDSTTWRIYFDTLFGTGFSYSESTDNWATWSTKTAITLPIPNNPQHGTILRVRDVDTFRNMAGLFMTKTASISGILNVTGGVSTTFLSIAGNLNLPANIRQTFVPGATNAGINVGATTGNPSSPTNGDIYYNSSSNELRARINGAWVALGAGGGGLPSGLSYSSPNFSAGTDVANQVVLSGSATGVNAKIFVTGSDTNVQLDISNKGATLGGIALLAGSGGVVFNARDNNGLMVFPRGSGYSDFLLGDGSGYTAIGAMHLYLSTTDNGQVKWNSGYPLSGGFDAGIGRDIAKYLKPTDGSTGNGGFSLYPVSANPANPSSSNELHWYLKGSSLVIQYNNAGTTRYFTLDLTQSSATPVWAQSTTAP